MGRIPEINDERPYSPKDSYQGAPQGETYNRPRNPSVGGAGSIWGAQYPETYERPENFAGGFTYTGNKGKKNRNY